MSASNSQTLTVDLSNAKSALAAHQRTVDALVKNASSIFPDVKTVPESDRYVYLLSGHLSSMQTETDRLTAEINRIESLIRDGKIQSLYVDVKSILDKTIDPICSVLSNEMADAEIYLSIKWVGGEPQTFFQIRGQRNGNANSKAAAPTDGTSKRGVGVILNGTTYDSGKAALDSLIASGVLPDGSGHGANAVAYVERYAKKHSLNFQRLNG